MFVCLLLLGIVNKEQFVSLFISIHFVWVPRLCNEAVVFIWVLPLDSLI